jgi:hypothetical protein
LIELPVAVPEVMLVQVKVTFDKVDVFTAFKVKDAGLHARTVPPLDVLSENDIGAGATTLAVCVLAQPRPSVTVTKYVPVVRPDVVAEFPPLGDHVYV